jgi:hypothetical protein
MSGTIFRALAAAFALAASGALASDPPQDQPPRWAVTGFGGISLDNSWEEVFVDIPGLQFQDAYLAGIAVTREVAEPIRGLSLEVEGQIVRHFGDQTHWEFNAPVLTARWGRFPWSDVVDTSFAFGLGLSVASETPALEVAQEGDSQAVMAYWMIEVDTELPIEDWRLVGRLHHRSSAYGLFGDSGGLNSLVLGLRREF